MARRLKLKEKLLRDAVPNPAPAIRTRHLGDRFCRAGAGLGRASVHHPLPRRRSAAAHDHRTLAGLARTGMTPDWMPGAVPRCVPVDTRRNQHGERAVTMVVDIERVLSDGSASRSPNVEHN